MSYQVNASIGLNTDDLRFGVSSALTDMAKLSGGVGKLARELQQQQQSMTMSRESMLLHRIENTRMSDAQKAVLAEVVKNNAALGKLTAQIDADNAAKLRQKQAVESLLGSLKRQADTLGMSHAQMQLYELRTNGATAAQIKQAQSTQNLIAAHERLNRVSSGGVSLGGALALAGGAGGIIQMADAWTDLQNRLKLVHQSSLDVMTAQSGILNIAKETGSGLAAVGQLYHRFAANQRELGLSTAQLVDLTSVVSKAVSLGGGAAASGEAALMQFGQALASGVLRGEEFNSIMEQAPGLAQTLAKGLNVNVAQLRAMAQEGKLTADTVVGALQRMQKSVNDDFAKTNLTISQSFEVLKTHLTEFVGKSSDASGAATVFSKSLVFVGKNIDWLASGLGLLLAAKVGVWATMGAAGLAQKAAAMIALRQAAATGAVAQTAHASSIARTGTAAQIAAVQVTGFSSAVNVLSLSAQRGTVAMSGLAGRAAALGGGLGGVGMVGVLALTSSITALTSAIDVARGKSGDNWISNFANDLADVLGIIDSKTESLGTKFFDLTQANGGFLQTAAKMVNPFTALHVVLKSNTDELNKQAQLAQTVSAKIGYTSVAGQLDKAGSVGAFKADSLKIDDLKKALGDTVIQYREQSEQLGKTKEQLALLQLETQKEILLKKQKQEFEKTFAQEKNKDDLVAQSMHNFTLELEKDFQAAKTAITDFATQTQAAERAQKTAQIAAQNRAKVDETLTSLSEKLKNAGKTAEELQRLELASAGATQAQLRQVEALQTAISLQERQNAVNQSLADLNNEIGKIGKSAKEIKLMDLEKQGASKSQLDYASALLDLQAAREKQFGLVGQTMLNAATVFEQSSETQRSYIEESWAREKAKIDAYNAEREAEIAKARLLREQPQFDPIQSDKFAASVEGFDRAVNAFSDKMNAQTAARSEPAMQKVSLDLTLPNGKVLSHIILAESSFVASIRDISVKAMYGEIAKQATAKS